MVMNSHYPLKWTKEYITQKFQCKIETLVLCQRKQATKQQLWTKTSTVINEHIVSMWSCKECKPNKSLLIEWPKKAYQ